MLDRILSFIADRLSAIASTLSSYGTRLTTIEQKFYATQISFTFNATNGGTINLGSINSKISSAYDAVAAMPLIASGTDTGIFGNSVQWMIYDGKIYVKTFKNQNNVKLYFTVIGVKK